MAIDKVGLNVPVGALPENTKSRDKQPEKSKEKDKVVLSAEALQLFAAEKAKKMEMIRERVNSRFYESRTVTEKVVEGLIRELKRPPTA